MTREYHGDSKNKAHLYNTWRAMKSRCYNKRDKSYKWYGAKGITVCNEWKESYVNFKQWALENSYVGGLTIDRIDVNRNYEPSNCCWKTIIEQANNRSDNLNITYNGETKNLKQWAKQLGISYQTLQFRICDAGWEIEKAFNEPLAYAKNQQTTQKIFEIYSNHPDYNGTQIAKLAGCGTTKVYRVLQHIKTDNDCAAAQV